MTTEATIRARHRDVQDATVGGHGGLIRCSCGETRSDPDMDCYVLEAELDDFYRARMDDDGAPDAR